MSGSTQPAWETPLEAKPAFKGAPNSSQIPERAGDYMSQEQLTG